MTIRRSAGGAATAGGMDFQHRVSAWVAVHILAEKSATPLWDLSYDTTSEWFRCESEQPVDDLMVGTSSSGIVLAQIKRTVQLSKAVDSELASAFDQFVRQFATCRSKSGGSQLWDRPLDPNKDRLVLIISPSSSNPVQVHLCKVLSKLQHRIGDRSIDNIASNAIEHNAFSIAQKHVNNTWRAIYGVGSSPEEMKEILSLVRVQVLDVEEGGADEQNAKNLLRQVVLEDTDQADTAWSELIKICATFAKDRSGGDRSTLQRRLLNAGLQLKVPRSYQNDIERLKDYSKTTCDALTHLAQIKIGSAPSIKIQRPSTDALRHAAEENSLLVVGEPGAGKSGALHDLVE